MTWHQWHQRGADVEQDRPVQALGELERLGPPRIPVDLLLRGPPKVARLGPARAGRAVMRPPPRWVGSVIVGGRIVGGMRAAFVRVRSRSPGGPGTTAREPVIREGLVPHPPRVSSMEMQPGQMAYDRAITVFSPDGRLFQVEYAREAVRRGATTAGVVYEDGVALVADRRIPNPKLAEPSSLEKIHLIDEHIACATAGLVADARVLVDYARLAGQINRVTYSEPITVELLARRICDYKQQYTQFGGVRPFGTALLVGGFDETGRPSLRDRALRLAHQLPGDLAPAATRAPRWSCSSRSTARTWTRTARSCSPSRASASRSRTRRTLGQVEVLTLDREHGARRLLAEEIQKYVARLPPIGGKPAAGARRARAIAPAAPRGEAMVEGRGCGRRPLGDAGFPVRGPRRPGGRAGDQGRQEGRPLRQARARPGLQGRRRRATRSPRSTSRRRSTPRDLAAIAREIILKGEVQVTTDQRHKLQEAKRRQIVATIARNAMNPQTGAPAPARPDRGGDDRGEGPHRPVPAGRPAGPGGPREAPPAPPDPPRHGPGPDHASRPSTTRG